MILVFIIFCLLFRFCAILVPIVVVVAVVVQEFFHNPMWKLSTLPENETRALVVVVRLLFQEIRVWLYFPVVYG